MKTWKRALALVLALVMALSLVALPSFAEGEETGGGTESTQPEWPNEGAIQLNKTAKPVQGQDGVYEITLTIEGKNYKTTSDVVLVIDNSNSMYFANGVDDDDGYESASKAPRMKNTIAAARAFADKLLTENSATRIALVVYGTNVHWSTEFYDAAHKSNLTQKLDEISQDINNGGTNQQAGIHKAQELLAASTGKQKNIVILSDGEATFCYEVTALNENVELGYTLSEKSNCGYGNNHKTPTIKLVASGVKDDTALTIKSCNYNTPIGSGSSFDLPYSWSINHTYSLSVDGYFNHPEVTGTYKCSHTISSYRQTWNYTIDANNSNGQSDSTVHITGYKDDTTTFSTKGSTTLDVTNCGQSTIWEANTAKAAGTTIFSVALQAGTNGENTLKDCATDPTAGYFAIAQNDDVETKLKDAFETIAGSIAIAAKNGTVVDPMSDHVSLNFEGDPTVTSDETAYNDGRADVYLSQGTVTRDGETLNWRVGNINEGTPAVMKYRVKLNDDVVSGQTYPTNKQTTFTYTDYQDHEASKDFPIPEVTPGGGTIRMHFYLVNDQGQPINREGVEVDSPDKAAELTLEEYFLYEGNKALNYGTYQVAKKDISGYTYYGYTLNGRDKNAPNVESRDTVAPVEVATTNANREVWFAYYQTFKVVHVQMDENGAAKTVKTETYPVSAEFKLTDTVATDYLYGGAFSDPACTTAYSFADGETGLSFAPKAGATYYIWEVPAAYLDPKTVFGREHNDAGQWDVNAFYMAFGIDRGYYKQVGFVMKNDKDVVANQKSLQHQDGKTELSYLKVGESVAFEKISLIRKDGGSTTYQLGNIVKGYSNGYIVCYGLPRNEWQNTSVKTVYTPYWVTLDGVKVYSNLTRTATYKGAGNPRMDTSDAASNKPCEAFQASAQTQLLLMATYCADSAAITPDTPAVENVTVTVVDGDKTAQYQVPAGAGVRDQVAYQAPAGKVFAGWFADQACTTPADLDQVTQDTTIYAKYVSDSYLDLDYSRIGLFRLRGVTLISAVDNPANYQASGFIVGDQKLDASYASRYLIFKTPASLFGAARDAKLMLADLDLSGVGVLEVTPYWVTLDGTEVHGVTHTLHYNTRTIWE